MVHIYHQICEKDNSKDKRYTLAGLGLLRGFLLEQLSLKILVGLLIFAIMVLVVLEIVEILIFSHPI